MTNKINRRQTLKDKKLQKYKFDASTIYIFPITIPD